MQVKILFVDDDESLREVTAYLLQGEGYEVITAGNGTEALARCEESMPDIVISDLSMPGMDGGKVFEAIRNDPALGDTKVLIITGKPELRRLIYDRPVQPPEGYLDKPVDEENLLANVKRILELAK